jgi:hypothetical protein
MWSSLKVVNYNFQSPLILPSPVSKAEVEVPLMYWIAVPERALLRLTPTLEICSQLW